MSEGQMSEGQMRRARCEGPDAKDQMENVLENVQKNVQKTMDQIQNVQKKCPKKKGLKESFITKVH